MSHPLHFAFKKKKHRRQNFPSYRSKELSTSTLLLHYKMHQSSGVVGVKHHSQRPQLCTIKTTYHISRLNTMIKLQAVLWQTVIIVDFHECQNRVLLRSFQHKVKLNLRIQQTAMAVLAITYRSRNWKNLSSSSADKLEEKSQMNLAKSFSHVLEAKLPNSEELLFASIHKNLQT